MPKEGVTFSVEGYLEDESLLWIGRGSELVLDSIYQ
jgi:hypothetical protein